MSGFQIFCGISGLVGAVANVLVIVISKIKKDSGNQDVQSTFLHICGSSILICLCMTATMSQEIRYDTAVIKIPHGFLAKSSPNFLTGIYAIQTSSYTYILFNISIMFLNRLNVICNKNTMSTIFSSKNMKIFTALAVIISLIQAAFVVLTAVDTNFLWERLNKTTTAIDDLFEKQEMSASFLQNQQIQIANQKQIDADMGIVPVANSNTTTNFKEQNRNQVEATRSRISVYGTDNSINPIIWASDTLLIIIFMASYITIIICSILIRNSLTNKQENLSDKMRISQKGLHTALVSYSLIPFVLAIIYFANYIQGIINKQFAFDIQSYISTATIALNPPLLGMSIFAFIKFYRQAFTEIILRQKPVEPKKEEMNEVDVEESKNMTTSQMRGMIKQGQEASTIAMPQ